MAGHFKVIKFNMATVAESEGHHPDFTVHYNVIQVSIWTHAIGGLSKNDFILAAKIDG
jgi:4a-hydroxytetrahydrobiopterin dehydratase